MFIFAPMKIFRKITLTLLSLTVLSACDKRDGNPDFSPERYDNVLVFYAPAYNNLSSDISRNLKTIMANPLPMKSSGKALVMVAHNSVNDSDYTTPTEPVIVRISSDWGGQAVLDTLKRFTSKDNILDKDIMKSAFSFISENFKSEHYGIVFSSHGTGWLPEDYYRRPLTQKKGEPKLKSFGAKYEGSPSHLTASHEILIQDLAEAIPIHCDYIIFDACLMGGVETAYELRKVTDKIGFSQAEVLSSGFDYKALTRDLINNWSPEDFCRSYFELYDKQSGSNRSATISVVDCSRLDDLAIICNRMFERYRTDIALVDHSKVQGFFTSDKHWFYDLEDILVKAGMSEADHQAVSSAIDACILYKACTEEILNQVRINSFCGLSSYLPFPGKKESTYLNTFYKTLAWNKATGFVY